MAQSSPPMRLIELSTHSCRCGDSPPPLDNLPGARAPLASAWDKDRRQRMRLRGVAAATAGGVLSAPGLMHRDARDRACAGDNWAAWKGAYAHRDAHRSVAEDVASKRAVASYDDGLQRRPPPVVAAARAAR